MENVLWELGKSLNWIDNETVGQILHDNLNIKKVMQKLVNGKQKEKRSEMCSDILWNIDNLSDL